MPQDKSAVESFLGDLGQRKENPFESADPFAVKAEEEKQDEQEQDEKPVPFHKDPKVQRFIEKEISKRMADVKPAAPERRSDDTEDDGTALLTRIIGNDTPEKQQAVKDFQKYLSSLEEKGAQRAMQQLQQQADKQAEDDRQAQEELESAFEEIKETYDVDLSSNTAFAKKTRADFIEYVRKIAPKNKEGEVQSFPDMLSAFEEYQERSKRSAPASRAKELASRSMSRSSDATTAPAATGKSWKDVERMFSKLSS